SWTIHLVFGDTPDLLAALKRGEVDAVVGSMRLVASGLTTLPIHDERYAFVASPQRLAQAPLRGPEDAGNHVLVDISADLPLFRYWRDQAPAEAQWSFGNVRYLGTIAAIRRWVLAGRGVSVLPRYFVADDLASGALVSVMPDVEPRADWFRLVWKEGHLRTSALQELGGFLRHRPLT
ncbi:MAG: substrate-binding domain-containing protein, partial [Myxococcota bacterium]